MIEVEGTLYCDAPGCHATAQGFLQFALNGPIGVKTPPQLPEWAIVKGNLLCNDCGGHLLPKHPPPVGTRTAWTPEATKKKENPDGPK